MPQILAANASTHNPDKILEHGQQAENPDGHEHRLKCLFRCQPTGDQYSGVMRHAQIDKHGVDSAVKACDQ